jgi:transcriptional regulator with XRE-family HTH domain
MTLKELRDNATLSQTELAARVGVSKAAISLWEAGIHTPRQAHIRKLALALKVSEREVKDAINALKAHETKRS